MFLCFVVFLERVCKIKNLEMALGVMWAFLVSGSHEWGPLGQFALTTSSTSFLYIQGLVICIQVFS
jgi:hypothetical protein